MADPRGGLTLDDLNRFAEIGLKKNLGLYLGPILLGYALDSMLLGVLVQQTIWNLVWSPADRTFNRVILFLAVALSGITTIFNLSLLFHLFAAGFGKWYRIMQINWVMWYPILDTATTTLVQMFYLERAYQLHNRAKWVPIVVLPFILAAIGGAMASTILASRLINAYDLRSTYPGFYTWISSTLITDFLITSIIFYRLIKSKTGWSSTDYLINRLIAVSVETQLPSLIVTMGFMISYGVEPVAGLNLFFEMFHPKVYVVGLLAVINSRQSLRDKIKPPIESRKMNEFGKKDTTLAQQHTIQLDASYIPDGSAIVPNLLVTVDPLAPNPDPGPLEDTVKLGDDHKDGSRSSSPQGSSLGS